MVTDDAGGIGYFAVPRHKLGAAHFVPIDPWVFGDRFFAATHLAPLAEAIFDQTPVAGSLADWFGGLVGLG